MGSYEPYKDKGSSWADGDVFRAITLNNLETGIQENIQNISFLTTAIENLEENISEVNQKTSFFVELDLEELIERAENNNLPFSYFEELLESKKFVYISFNQKEYGSPEFPSETFNHYNQGIYKLTDIGVYGDYYWIDFENINSYTYYKNTIAYRGGSLISFTYSQFEEGQKTLADISMTILDENKTSIEALKRHFYSSK